MKIIQHKLSDMINYMIIDINISLTFNKLFTQSIPFSVLSSEAVLLDLIYLLLVSLLVLLEPLSRRQHVQEALITQTILQLISIIDKNK